MTLFNSYIAALGCSSAVFELTLSSDGSHIEGYLSNPVNKYVPTYIEDDAISMMVCENYSEIFNNGKFSVDKEHIKSRCCNVMKGSLINLIDRKLKTKMKNPRLSKLHRWFYYLGDRNDNFDTIFQLWQYGKNNSDTKHQDNLFEILQAWMKKDSSEN